MYNKHSVVVQIVKHLFLKGKYPKFKGGKNNFAKGGSLKGDNPIAYLCKLLVPFGSLVNKHNNLRKFVRLQSSNYKSIYHTHLFSLIK